MKYPQATEDEVETKVITRTIKYVDASNENTEVSPKVEQTVTLIRTNKRNKVTNTLEEGTWTQGSWAEQASPTVANYGTPDKTSVSLAEVTPTMEDTEVIVKYPQAKEDEVERKVITRTINYLEKGTNKVLKDPTVETVTLTRPKTTNKVTKEVTYGEWSKGSWSEVTPEAIANYKAPSVTTVERAEVTSTTENKTIDVYYEADIKPEPKPEPKPEEKPKPKSEPKPEPKPKDVSVMQGVRELANTGEKTTGFGALGLISLVAAEVARRKKQN
ncbi:MucBP domain protein [Gemella haemolysans]|nr:MucBP domain protein [Gemella haemolysans]